MPAGTYYISVDGVGFGSPASASPTGYTDYGSLGQYRLTGEITPAGLRIRPIAVAADKPEGDTGNTIFEFDVEISEAQPNPVSIDWSVAGFGIHQANANDFGGSFPSGTFPSGTVTIPGGQIRTPLRVQVAGDTAAEFDEEFTVILSNPSIEASPGTARGIIRNDDQAAILLVDDDQGAAMETPFENALGANGFVFESWEVSSAGLPTATDLLAYQAVIWNTGYELSGDTAGLSSAEQTAIAAYLDGGGRMFISGQDILFSTVTTPFQSNYLKVADFTNDALAVPHVSAGVAGNPIGDGLNLSFSIPAGYDNLWVDGLTPVAGAEGVLALPGTQTHPYSAVSYRGDYAAGDFGIVFFAAPFEGISTSASAPNNQVTVMNRIINFLLPPNQPPTLTVDSGSLSGNVLTQFTNGGTWNDVATDNVTLTASLGAVTKNTDGSWDWSYTPSAKATDAVVTITASDGIASNQIQFSYTSHVEVTNRQVYYKGSAYSASGSNVQAALDPNKVLARAGSTPQTLSYANVINTTRGINGLVLDVAGLVSATLAPDNFRLRMSPQGLYDDVANPPDAWQLAPTPSMIDVVPGTSTTAARVRLEWPDNVIENRWLQVTVLASEATGMDEDAVFYIGHLKGELNGQILVRAFFVSNADLAMVLPVGGGLMPITESRDIDKNRIVSNADRLEVRNSVVDRLQLRNITIPALSSGGANGAPGSPLAEGGHGPGEPQVQGDAGPLPAAASIFQGISPQIREDQRQEMLAEIFSSAFSTSELRSTTIKVNAIPQPEAPINRTGERDRYEDIVDQAIRTLEHFFLKSSSPDR